MTVHYCDNYEALTGRERDPDNIRAVQVKVVKAPEPADPEPAEVEVETA